MQTMLLHYKSPREWRKALWGSIPKCCCYCYPAKPFNLVSSRAIHSDWTPVLLWNSFYLEMIKDQTKCEFEKITLVFIQSSLLREAKIEICSIKLTFTFNKCWKCLYEFLNLQLSMCWIMNSINPHQHNFAKAKFLDILCLHRSSSPNISKASILYLDDPV